MDFSKRSYEKELLDGDDIPFEDIKQNMQELESINSKLGGHAITMKGFRALAGNDSELSVCEIGCGGGDNIKAIEHWAKKQNKRIKFTGIDINNECIEYARENCSQVREIDFIISDYKLVEFPEKKPDIIFSSLFCHHLNDSQINEMLHWCSNNSVRGFFINDLHRHPMAYQSIKMLTKLFSNSYLVKNDAPLSVRRGFVKEDWERLLNEAHIKDYTISWQWAFRWLVIARATSGERRA